ncbi:peptidase M48 [bacterium]|nr:MAG: peptidase M48 [bacterium]
MPVKPRIFRFALLSLSLFLLSGCVTIYNPATQKRETLLIDTQEEIKLGEDMDKQIKRELKIMNDPKMQGRLGQIGQKIASVSDRQDLSYNFRIVKDKDLNAFAIPGGFIYVNSGLMDAANNDELAFVLAHEIGHVAARHSVKQLQATLGYQIVISLVLGSANQQAMAKAINIVFNLTSLGYSRKDEFLADELAVKYAKKAGYNPRGAVTFFNKLKTEAKKNGPNFNLVFLSSHPPVDERIKKVEDKIVSAP